jgi:hypothetical protein
VSEGMKSGECGGFGGCNFLLGSAQFLDLISNSLLIISQSPSESGLEGGDSGDRLCRRRSDEATSSPESQG